MKTFLFTLLLLINILQISYAQWQTSGTNLYYNNGNVGIGTINPGRILDIQQSNNNRSYLRIRENSSNTVTDGGAFLELTGTRSDGTIGYYGGILGGRESYTFDNKGYLAFYADNDDGKSMIERMRINTSGNLLIGKATQTNLTYKLDVQGTIRANKVVVNTTGADFVFSPSYNLLPLSDLQKFIEQQHHLPDIEPAAQMEKEGLNVGDNQIKLLQKIEELTLYIINKDQQIITEQKINQSQQQEIDSLKEQVRELTQLMSKINSGKSL